jgi:hypothetical protein
MKTTKNETFNGSIVNYNKLFFKLFFEENIKIFYKMELMLDF